MERYFLVALLIGITIAVEPLKETNSCVEKIPEKPEDCFGLETEKFRQTCCYFYGSYSDNGKDYKTGPACLEADRIDVSNGTIKHQTQKKIEEGKYWKDYAPIKNITSFLCYDSISECEKKQPATSEKECFNAKAELPTEGCCYLESDWKEGDREEKDIIGSCIDIKLVDSETKQKMEETKKKILDGTYWDGDYGVPTKINKFVCANTKSTESSTIMKVNFILLCLSLILF